MHVFIYYYMSFIVIVIISITIIISMGTVGTCYSGFFFFSFSMNCFSFLGCRACFVPVISRISVQYLQMTVNSFPLTAQC